VEVSLTRKSHGYTGECWGGQGNLDDVEGVDENSVDDKESLTNMQERGGDEVTVTISDPIEPFNRVMYHFNDKLTSGCSSR